MSAIDNPRDINNEPLFESLKSDLTLSQIRRLELRVAREAMKAGKPVKYLTINVNKEFNLIIELVNCGPRESSDGLTKTTGLYGRKVEEIEMFDLQNEFHRDLVIKNRGIQIVDEN